MNFKLKLPLREEFTKALQVPMHVSLDILGWGGKGLGCMERDQVRVPSRVPSGGRLKGRLKEHFWRFPSLNSALKLQANLQNRNGAVGDGKPKKTAQRFVPGTPHVRS